MNWLGRTASISHQISATTLLRTREMRGKACLHSKMRCEIKELSFFEIVDSFQDLTILLGCTL